MCFIIKSTIDTYETVSYEYSLSQDACDHCDNYSDFSKLSNTDASRLLRFELLDGICVEHQLHDLCCLCIPQSKLQVHP